MKISTKLSIAVLLFIATAAAQAGSFKAGDASAWAKLSAEAKQAMTKLQAANR